MKKLRLLLTFLINNKTKETLSHNNLKDPVCRICLGDLLKRNYLMMSKQLEVQTEIIIHKIIKTNSIIKMYNKIKINNNKIRLSNKNNMSKIITRFHSKCITKLEQNKNNTKKICKQQ